MKLLKEFHSEVDADNLSERLRGRGILTHVSSKRSHRLSTAKTGALKLGVWGVLPQQYDDAYILLSNKKHKPTYMLSPEEILELEYQTKLE